MEIVAFARVALATAIGLALTATGAGAAPAATYHLAGGAAVSAAFRDHDTGRTWHHHRLRGGTHIFRPAPRGVHGRFRQASPDGPFTYHGGTLIDQMKVYVVFWQWNNDPDGVAPYVSNLVRDVGGSSWLENDTQYYDNTGTHIENTAQFEKGVWYDYTDPMPHDPQLSDFMAEALAAQQHFVGHWDPNAVYVIATPSGAQDPYGGRGFPNQLCSEHSWTYADNAGKEGVPFVNLPYEPDALQYGTNCYAYVEGGLLDGVGVSLGHELAETQTDPVNTGGWWAPDSDPGTILDEVGDMCVGNGYEQLFLLSGVYAVQDLWDNQSTDCSFYLPKKWTQIAIGGGGQIWGLGADPYTGGHAVYSYAPPNYPANFYSVIGFGASMTVDNNGTPWVIENKKLYYYSAADGFHLVPSPPASQVSVGLDGGVWILGAKKTGGGYPVYERGGTLGYSTFTRFAGIKATSISAQGGSGYALAVDNAERFRQYSPLSHTWNYLAGPAGLIAVSGSDAAGGTYMLATPTQGTNYTVYGYNLNNQTWFSMNFMGTYVTVGPNGDPWVIQSNQYLYHYVNGQFQNM
jgi:hypothetical protein